MAARRDALGTDVNVIRFVQERSSSSSTAALRARFPSKTAGVRVVSAGEK
jgi:hypothetical protein